MQPPILPVEAHRTVAPPPRRSPDRVGCDVAPSSSAAWSTPDPQNDCEFTRNGRKARLDYAYRVPNQWQGRYRRLRVIGDKKGGRSTRRLSSLRQTRQGAPWTPTLLARVDDIIAEHSFLAGYSFDGVAG